MSIISRLPRPVAVPLFCSCASILALPGVSASAGDPFADSVVFYDAGLDANPGYLDPGATLGSPERFTGEDVFPSVVSPFNPPFGSDEIVSIGRGGSIVIGFDEPVTDDATNPFGVDLLVFSNAAFIDGAFPSGFVIGMFSADGGVIEVSEDGVTWVVVEDVDADGMFPTLGYADADPYAEMPGRVNTDFTRPVDPSLSFVDFDGITHTDIVALYDGAGGGAGVDLATTGLAAVSFVRITNPIDAERDIQIDAVSDVAPDSPSVPGDVDGDGAVDFTDLLSVLADWGICPAPPATCPADLDASGGVDFTDLLIVLAGWTR